MTAKDPSIFERISIQSVEDSGRVVDITALVNAVQYFEDIFSPTITAKILVVNTGQTIKNPDGDELQSLYNLSLIHI